VIVPGPLKRQTSPSPEVSDEIQPDDEAFSMRTMENFCDLVRNLPLLRDRPEERAGVGNIPPLRGTFADIHAPSIQRS
jgi:hypothetical protein